MARDYSNRGNGNPGRSNNKRNGARSNNKRKSAKKNTRKQNRTPGWAWLASGLCIGITVAAFAYIITRPTNHPGRDINQTEVLESGAQENAQSSAKDAAQKTQTAKTEQATQPRFSFYEILPDYEVVIPPGQLPDNSDSSNDSHATPQTTQQEDTSPSQPTYGPGIYVIQAGSFADRKDANQLRARLTLLGMDARIVRYQFDTGRVVYRVRSQHIESSNRLTQWLKRLRDNGIATLVLRQSS